MPLMVGQSEGLGKFVLQIHRMEVAGPVYHWERRVNFVKVDLVSMSPIGFVSKVRAR